MIWTYKGINFLRIGFLIFCLLILAFGGEFVLKKVVLSRLEEFDETASFSDIDYGFNSLIISDLKMPARGLQAEAVYFVFDKNIIPSSPLHVVFDGCTVVRIESQEGSEISEEARSLPVISVLNGFSPDYKIWFYGSRIDGVNFANVYGDWGYASGRIEDDSLVVAFSSCSDIPNFDTVIPSIAKGHTVSGILSGSFRDKISVEGFITELDNEAVLVAFKYCQENNLPSAELSMDFSLVEESFISIVDSISRGSLLSISPSGSLCVGAHGLDSIAFRTDLFLDSIVLFNESIAADTILTSIELSLLGYVELDSCMLVIDSGSASIGESVLNFDLNYSWNERRRLRLRVYNDSLQGEPLIESIPSELLGRLNGLTLSGSLALSIQLILDWDFPDSCDIHFDINTDQLYVGSSPITFGAIKDYRGVTYRMRDSWGNTALIGLDTLTNPEFVYFDSLPFYFEPLLRCAEDATFRRHNGFSEYHIRNSIRANIAEGRFVRGGSTISMQLVKNLFLTREKTLARKMQEVFLTWRLERWLSKDRILEVYANIVELGPATFGFNSAAIYYFNEPVTEISVKEMAFLISILPGPKLYHRYAVSGELPYHWNSYVERLISICGNRGWLEESVVSAALTDTLIFDGIVSQL